MRAATPVTTSKDTFRSVESQSVPHKIEEIESVLADLTRERDELDEQVQTMIGDMATAPEEQRRSGEWAADGAATARYLALTERLAEVEQTIIDLTRQRVMSGTPPSVH